MSWHPGANSLLPQTLSLDFPPNLLEKLKHQSQNLRYDHSPVTLKNRNLQKPLMGKAKILCQYNPERQGLLALLMHREVK